MPVFLNLGDVPAANGIALEALMERYSQFEQYGYTPEKDDKLTQGQLIGWAISRLQDAKLHQVTESHKKWARQQLLVGIALAMAEVERLDRKAGKDGKLG